MSLSLVSEERKEKAAKHGLNLNHRLLNMHKNALEQRLPSFLNDVQENVRRRSSSVNSTDFLIDQNTQNAISQIKTKYTGALCDSEGFYQHYGECWNDAISMIFLFTDGLKEITQEKLAMNDVNINFIPKESIITIITIYNIYRNHLYNIAKNTRPDLIPPAIADNELIESLLFYIMFLKNRFVRHYVMESERRQQQGDEVCTLDKNPIKVLHSMGKNAVLSALFGNPGKKTKNLKDYISHNAHGANQFVIENLINMLIAIFFPKGKYDIISKGYISYEEALTIKSYIYAIHFSTENHGLCFYTCGGNDFFYEDNFGPFLFPWREILFSNKETLEIGITSILFTTLSENHSIITVYYPVIRLKNGKYFTFYNKKLYTFPTLMFDSPERPTLYSFDDIISFSFDYAHDKIITFANKKWMLPIIKETGLLENLNVSNRGFTFKRSRLSRNDYTKAQRKKRASKYGLNLNNPLLNLKNNVLNTFVEDKVRREKERKEKATKYGLNLNNPLLNWEEHTLTNGFKYWYNPVTYMSAYQDPFLNDVKSSPIKSPSLLNRINPYTRYKKWKNARRTESRKNNYKTKKPSFWNKINPFRRK